MVLHSRYGRWLILVLQPDAQYERRGTSEQPRNADPGAAPPWLRRGCGCGLPVGPGRRRRRCDLCEYSTRDLFAPGFLDGREGRVAEVEVDPQTAQFRFQFQDREVFGQRGGVCRK